MIDTHAHLQGLEGGAGAAIEEAAAAGVGRIVCIGDSPELAEEAIVLARRHPGVVATVGLHPHRAELWSDAVRSRLDELLDDPAVVAVGETGLDYFRDRAPRDAQALAFAGQVVLAEKHRKPLVIHTREAADDTLAVLRGARTAVVLHCFSLPEHLDEVVERGWYVSFAGNVTYPSATDLAEAARRVPAELLLLETDCPYLSPVPHRGKPNRPALRARDAACGGGDARRGCSHAGRAGRGERRARLRAAVNAPRQVTLARLAELGLRPDRELGQHFLVDDNLLGVIERLAGLRARDVALEIGAGVGTLTARLAERLRPRARSRDRPPPRGGAHAHARGPRQRHGALGRCHAARPDGLEPPATAFVANLPYHVAAPLILDSIGDLPGIERWCVLVQKEIGERLTAAARHGAVRRAERAERAGARADGPPCGVAQRVRARAERRLDPGGVRTPAGWPELAGDWPAIVATVRAAFAYRRKTVANALTLAGWRASRAAVGEACAAAGVDPGARAEALAPDAFLRLARTP